MLTLIAFASRLENQDLLQNPSGNVVNLSKYTFSIPEYNILGKNLNLCPTPGNYNNTTLQTDISNFLRKIKLKAHFGATENENNNKKEFYIKKQKKHMDPKTNTSHCTNIR